ncbi:MAG TPA: nitrilase-related carbon-nitrogen hydrolase [Candidatus Angelobacter sp.]|jgi:N-carbamoylputrescine amidase|nr:nitrilase-related carbon-nitrogen hydrolase [Candidatus Angelobacter sp.]
MSEASPGRSARVAVAQYEPHVGDLDGNREQAVLWARRAAAEGADLVVLPELASSGYTFESEAEAQAMAEDPDEGPTVAALLSVSRDTGVHIVCGLDERDGDCRHNSAVLLGPSGRLATYRKLHLFYDEQTWFVPGTSLPVVELPFGRVGMIICYDLWFPEPVRALALAGADIVAVPTNWVASFKRTVYDDRGYCQGDYVAMATAAQNGVVMACADRIGSERGLTFLGASIIVGADGWPVAGPAPADAEALLVADVAVGGAAAARQRTPRNHLLGDRRPDAYTVEPVSPHTAPATTPRGAERVASQPTL